MLVPGDIVEIECTDLLAKTGQAVGRHDGMVVYAWGPIPGERARVRIEAVKPRYAVGELLAIVRASPDRAEPFCPVFGVCGGCQVQHLAYEAQLRWKQTLVAGALRRIGGIEGPPVAPPIATPERRNYRNKMALVVEHGVSPPAFGFYAARSHDVVPLDGCPIVLRQLDRYIGDLNAAVRDDASAPALAEAKHVIARAAAASGEAVVALTTEVASPAVSAAAPALAAHLPGVVGIVNSAEPRSPNAVMGRRSAIAFGKNEIEETIAGLRFRVSPASFFQVNGAIVAAIFAYLERALAAAAPATVLDCYCGAGTFSLFFARAGAKVTGIEENPNAIREARENAALNGLSGRTRFVAGRVDSTLRAPRARELLASTAVAFLDPPRKGSDEITLATLIRGAVPRIWYLSCSPATLARDAAQLVAGGYRFEGAQPFDMFPQTGHVEALGFFRRPEVAPLELGFGEREA